MSTPVARKIVFAGGGTAGHVEPALAVARAWKEKYPKAVCLFLGTPQGLENFLVPAAGFEIYNIDKVVMPRNISMDLVKLPIRLYRSVSSSKKFIKGSDLLIGFGGYLSASAYIAAWISKVPIVVHEANVKVGWANRLGALFTKHLAVSRPVKSGPFALASVTGLPLRVEVREAFTDASKDWPQARKSAKEKLGWNSEKPTLLILGGSQGSAFINAQIAISLPVLLERGIQILHSVGADNQLPQESENYRAVPYIVDMATSYLAADVILARSGAVTCAEVGALGRMAIFVPLPIGNGEQARNADYLVSSGRAILIPQMIFSSSWLIDNIDGIFEQSKKRAEGGLSQDMESEKRIVTLMETALRRTSR